jgi:hypothetical protein
MRRLRISLTDNVGGPDSSSSGATISKYHQQAMKGWNILDNMLQTTSTSLTRDRMDFMNTLGLTNTQVIMYDKIIVR